MISYKKGDLLKAEGILAHGVNCVGGFGSGVAGQIATQFPEAKKLYLYKHCMEGWKLGDIQIAYVSSTKIIVNAATQNKYFPRDVVNADYPAIRTVLEKLYALSSTLNLPVHIPKIGCGLAGGDWHIVEDIINDVFKDKEITVWTL